MILLLLMWFTIPVANNICYEEIKNLPLVSNCDLSLTILVIDTIWRIMSSKDLMNYLSVFIPYTSHTCKSVPPYNWALICLKSMDGMSAYMVSVVTDSWLRSILIAGNGE